MFAQNEYYHIYNRGVNKRKIFLSPQHYRRAVETLQFYLFTNHKIRFSYYSRLGNEAKQKYFNDLSDTNISLLSYVLMPNHFHLLVTQTGENGISNYLRLFENSYTRYFNTATKRIGPLLQGAFKAVRIETNDQLLHITRYIHLNPYSSNVVSSMEELEKYPWSSYRSYLEEDKNHLIDTDIISSQFQNLSYKNFVSEQGEYQRELDEIKHLTFENDFSF